MELRTPEQIANQIALSVATYSDPNKETGLYEPIIESQADLMRLIQQGIEIDRQQHNPSLSGPDREALKKRYA